MTAEQSTTVRPSAASTIRKPSVCRNIWLFLFFFFFHPRSPLMCAASSCVSTGRQPIRIRPGLLMLWPEKLHNTGLFDLSDRIILWPAGDKIKQREFLMSLAHPSYLEPTSIQPVFPLTWQLEPIFFAFKVEPYTHMITQSYCTWISALDSVCTWPANSSGFPLMSPRAVPLCCFF